MKNRESRHLPTLESIQHTTFRVIGRKPGQTLDESMYREKSRVVIEVDWTPEELCDSFDQYCTEKVVRIGERTPINDLLTALSDLRGVTRESRTHRPERAG